MYKYVQLRSPGRHPTHQPPRYNKVYGDIASAIGDRVSK